MLPYDITDELRKKLQVLAKKDKVLVNNFKSKLLEIINRDNQTINAYKNLKSPMNKYKRIHLTSNYILIFEFNKGKVTFIDIKHRDHVYKK